jgi:hypothetical protein
VCGGRDCTQVPQFVTHHHTYPFLPGGIDPMEGTEFVIATERVVDPDTGTIVYGAQDRVPWDDAVRFGLVERPKAAPAKRQPRKGLKRSKKGPVEDRARKPSEDR